MNHHGSTEEREHRHAAVGVEVVVGCFASVDAVAEGFELGVLLFEGGAGVFAGFLEVDAVAVAVADFGGARVV